MDKPKLRRWKSMAAATIRLGKISSINYTAGKARVVV